MTAPDNNPIRFTVTADHITLLRHMYVGWQDCETGAPEIDPKRPYGNSSVAYDVAELLGWPMDNRELTGEQRARALILHRETTTALQIVLMLGTFEPGDYRRTNPYLQRSWERAK